MNLPHQHPVSITQFIGAIMEKGGKSESPGKGPACPQCGITFGEFKNQGRLGCAHDYTFFKERLEKLLKKVHGSVKYVGKVPPGYESTQIHQNELIKLKRRLKKVVKAEEYEEAARIRDRIIELESMIRGSGNTEESEH
jgi:protein arginine kinase activator